MALPELGPRTTAVTCCTSSRRSHRCAPVDDPNPFIAFGRHLAWHAFAAHARHVGRRRATRSSVSSTRRSPRSRARASSSRSSARRHALSEELGFAADGGVWVKDETGNVGGSHKARHLMTILLHLRAAETLRTRAVDVLRRAPPLAIASCGNAAIAAATLAAAVEWPITVFVPPWASSDGDSTCSSDSARSCRSAHVSTATRRATRASTASARRSPPVRSRSACRVRRTRCASTAVAPIGWEMTEVLGHLLDRVFVQVGGGALAACVGSALRSAGIHPALHAVQTDGVRTAGTRRGSAPRHSPVAGRGAGAAHWREPDGPVGADRHDADASDPRPTASSTTRPTTGSG